MDGPEQDKPTVGNHAGSHHGDPDLFDRDIKLLQDYQKWVKTANDEHERLKKETGYENTYGPNWVPSIPDMLKSRLFWRIRCGKAPLKEAPPTSYSCSWYELIEVLEPHPLWSEEVRVHRPGDPGARTDKTLVWIAQDAYDLVAENEDGSMIVKHNCYYFKTWKGKFPTTKLVNGTVEHGEREGWMIMHLPNYKP